MRCCEGAHRRSPRSPTKQPARPLLDVHYGSFMDEGDVALRNLTYRLFVELGRAPTADDAAAAAGSSATDVRKGWERLHDAHALVLQTGLTELRMANPFSAVPTAYRVLARGPMVVRELRVGRIRRVRRAARRRPHRNLMR